MPPDESQQEAEAEAVFHLHDLNAPRLSGTSAWLSTALLESPFGAPLRNRILATSGFVAFRQRAREKSEQDIRITPRNLPIHYLLPPSAPPATLTEVNNLFHALSPREESSRPARPTIRSYYEAYRSGRVTPTQVVQTLQRLIDVSNGPDVALNAVICQKPQDALAQAAASTLRWSQNAPLSTLDGVPYTVKDSIDVANYPTRCASSFLTDEGEAMQENDADVVRACREAGMVMVGKCNMDELGVGVRGFSMFSGQTRNPHNIAYVPGGSSGGSAAAVAAGLSPVSLGSDAAGSIRIPAACCGVFGLKASFARISTHGRVLSKREEFEDDLSPLLHTGPITGCAEDLVLMYYLLSGCAPHRLIPSEPLFKRPFECVPEQFSTDISNMRIGVCRPWARSGSETAFSTMQKALDTMVEQGALEVPLAIPDLEDIRVSLSIAIMNKFLASLKEPGYYGEGSNITLGYDARMKLKMGEQFTEEDLARSKVVRTRAMDYCVSHLFGAKELDIIVTPALAIDIPQVPENLATGLIDANTDSKMMKFAFYASYVGIPACVIPIGKDATSGLPCAVQVMAAPWNERKLLEVCLWAEKQFQGSELYPERCYNPLQEAIHAT